jgi:RNA-directed DNA polymerase
MTTMVMPSIGASSANGVWDAIDWQRAQQVVHRLQMRIAKAMRERRYGKVRALQWLLTHSYYAKALAVKRVTQNRGHRTAGVDGITWTTAQQKLKAIGALKRRGYQPQPLRRISIPKKNGKTRPLGIPTMADRAMQALHLLALEPVSETLADPNTYGFRPKRSAADAIGQCFSALAKKRSAQWIFEGDIRACFDQISHPWLLANTIMDRVILSKWLAMGYLENGSLYPTESGTPQGGIASPTLALMALSGLEAAVKNAVPRRHKVHVVAYADDFIITGVSKELLEMKVKPAVEVFLKARGLELSAEKTRITHIDEGFDFLGFNIRKYKGKLLTKPAKSSVKAFLGEIRAFIKSNKAAKTAHVIWQLNSKLRGWSNYYRHAAAKCTFDRVDHQVFLALWSWAKRRHPNKPAQWVQRRYFRSHGQRHWVFSTSVHDKQGKSAFIDLMLAGKVPITRHVKIRAAATPYDPAFTDYFADRARSRRVNRSAWPEEVADVR